MDQILELLGQLKGGIEDFARRESALETEFRNRAARENLRRDEAATAEAGRFETRLTELAADHEAAKAALTARHARRKAWITKARTLSKDQAQERIEAKTGAQKYGLQKKLMQAEKDRDAALAKAAATTQQFKADLAAEDEQFVALEQSARRAFGSYGSFKRRLAEPAGGPLPASADSAELLGAIRDMLKKAGTEIAQFRRLPLPLLFRFLPLWLLLPLCLLPLAPALLDHLQIKALSISLPLQTGALISGGLIALVLVLYFAGRATAAGPAGKVIRGMGQTRQLLDAAFQLADTWYQDEVARIRSEFQSASAVIDEDLKLALKDNLRMKGSFRETVDDKTVRVTAHNDRILRDAMQRLEAGYAETVRNLKAEAEAGSAELARAAETSQAAAAAELRSRWEVLQQEWQARIHPIYESLRAASDGVDELFPPWTRELLEAWTPPEHFLSLAKFARLDVEVEKLCDGVPKDQRLSLPGPGRFAVPLFLTYPNGGSILFEMANAARETMIGALNNIILRLLSHSPPGRLNFTVIDPIGLGQNFAGVMHMADYEAQIINSRIWTQTAQIEQKLADLNEHMEKVIQMYLRNEYATIAEYNEQAGNIAEKYHFLVVADFPANFSETAIKRLQSIAASGARCGVYTLIHWDQRQPAPPEFIPKDFRASSVSLTARGNEIIFTGKLLPGTTLQLDPPPPPDLATEFVHKLGTASRDSSRVEVPFEHVAPPPQEVWTLDTTSELQVPIGRTGATKLQYLAIGKGTRQHALVAGKTGSGKSTLFHVIITNLALWASPEQVEFYLVDFKKGVEFKCYASRRLPHARVIAIESDREFGLSVLQRVDDELRRRGDMFRKLGAQDIAGYKRAGGTEAIPRSLLIIDEFQEFFVEDDKISQTASVLLDRIVRQGRAFGIHVILGSQTLGGAYTLARTTIGQMVIRIALQCNEADAYLIMDENNPAPRLLSRPGEGIYNDTAGSVEGNSPFQVVWLPDEVRDHNLESVRAHADQFPEKFSSPFVFEGNAPADIRENELLAKLLAAPATTVPSAPRIWLGAPNSIKGPTEAVFRRQNGNHLILVGQREEAALSILAVALVSLAAQFPKGAVRLIVFDGNPPDTPQRAYLERVIGILPHPAILVRVGEQDEAINNLALDLKARAEGGSAANAPATFIFINGLQRFGKLRHEESFGFSGEESAPNPGAQLNDIICEGAGRGLHVIASIDTYNNVNRWLSRKALTEFEMRVLFQMSVNDSASLIDSPKASTLGLHRALFYNEQEGYTETFRPYALPDGAWIDRVEAGWRR